MSLSLSQIAQRQAAIARALQKVGIPDTDGAIAHELWPTMRPTPDGGYECFGCSLEGIAQALAGGTGQPHEEPTEKQPVKNSSVLLMEAFRHL